MQENPLTATIKSHLFSAIPTVLKPTGEAITNYSMFRDGNIIPEYLKPVPKEFQYTAATSETAKALSKKLDGLVSPIMLDHYIQSTLTRYGSLATSIIDNTMFDEEITDIRPEKGLLGKALTSSLNRTGTQYELSLIHI